MKFDYARMQGRADYLIARYNEEPFQVKRKAGPNQMVNGEVVIAADTLIDVVGVCTVIDKNLVNNTTILQGDLLMTIKHDIEPLMTDVFIVDEQDYEVVAIEKYQPSSTILAYKVQLRA